MFNMHFDVITLSMMNTLCYVSFKTLNVMLQFHCYLTVLRPHVAVSACLDVFNTALYDGRGIDPCEVHAHLSRFVPGKVFHTHLPCHVLSSITRRWPNRILQMQKL